MDNVVKGKIGVWIWPSRQYEVDRHEGQTLESHPYQAKLDTGRPWEPSAVKVHEQEIGILVPSNINLHQKMIDTLEEDRATLLRDTQEKLEKLNAKLVELRQLTWDGALSTEIMEGEVVQTPFGRDVA
jgi:hypothetical protein